jgi:hypothetical protein
MNRTEKSKKGDFEAEVNEINAVMYIQIGWGEKGPPKSKIDQEDNDESITPKQKL